MSATDPDRASRRRTPPADAFGAGVILLAGRAMVLVRRGAEGWMCLGGGSRPGETPRATAARELLAGSGVAMRAADLETLQVLHGSDGYLFHVFLARIAPTAAIRAGEGADAWGVFPVGAGDDAFAGLPAPLHPAMRALSADAAFRDAVLEALDAGE